MEEEFGRLWRINYKDTVAITLQYNDRKNIGTICLYNSYINSCFLSIVVFMSANGTLYYGLRHLSTAFASVGHARRSLKCDRYNRNFCGDYVLSRRLGFINIIYFKGVSLCLYKLFLKTSQKK